MEGWSRNFLEWKSRTSDCVEIAKLVSMLNKAILIMPKDAPHIKVNATNTYGANLVFDDGYAEDQNAIARQNECFLDSAQ
jgi:hypothetical protein